MRRTELTTLIGQRNEFLLKISVSNVSPFVSIRSEKTLETSALENLYGGQFTSPTHLIKQNRLVIPPSPPPQKKQNKTKQKQTNKKTRCITAVSLGAYSVYSAVGKLRPNC